MRSLWLRSVLSLVLLIIFIMVLAWVPKLVADRSGHLSLLTVSSSANGTHGGIADVYLTIKPGRGDVYIDTFPFTKLDTQISTRFAKEVACKTVNQDCENYDFFYTIRASSSIVGGPSAGAALAAVTAAVLMGKPIDQGVAITGTINSGGIVGSVAGIDEKIGAAQNAGLHTVLIPRWHWDERDQLFSDANASVMDQYSALVLTSPPPRNVTVLEVVTIDQAISAITGENFSLETGELEAPAAYRVLMKLIANRLCNRSSEMMLSLPADADASLLNISTGFLESSRHAFDRGDFYSAASFCYSANIRLREVLLANYSDERLQVVAANLNQTIAQKRIDLSAESLDTITDLQTRAIVDERLNEAQDYLGLELSPASVARGVERYYSAVVWSNFFQLSGASLSLDQDHLRRACEAKLAEVEERQSYLSVLLNDYVDDSDELKAAYASYHADEYALCIFRASKEKGRIDLLISGAAVDPEHFSEFLDEKLLVTKGLIYREIQEGRFPVMGYSYYEYANSLKDDDEVNAALFASYALELSDLGLYFPTSRGVGSRILDALRSEFFLGFISGVLLLLLVWLSLKPLQR